MTPDDTIRRRLSFENHDGIGASSNWSTLVGRMFDDLSRIFQLELQLLESRLIPSLTAMVDRAILGMIVLFAGVVGGCCLLTALIVLLHRWLPWWQGFAIAGGLASAAAAIAYTGLNHSTSSAESARS